MGFTICAILPVFCLVAPIWAAFKDFVIEDEKDLQYSAVSNDETMYDELRNYDFYDDENCNDIESIYDDYGDFSHSHDIFKRIAGRDIDIIGNDIDEHVLSEVIRQLVNDPSFQQLQKHFGGANNVGGHKEHLSPPDYMDYCESDEDCMYSE